MFLTDIWPVISCVLLLLLLLLIIAVHSLHLSMCALFEIMENGHSILQNFFLISTKCCQLQGTLSSEPLTKSFAGGK